MNSQELARTFVMGALSGESSALKIKRLSPHVYSIMHKETGEIFATRIQCHDFRRVYVVQSYPRLEMAWGARTHGARSEAFSSVFNTSGEIVHIVPSHVNTVEKLVEFSLRLPRSTTRWEVILRTELQGQGLEARTERDLINAFPRHALLRNSDDSLIVASPIKQCSSCKRIKPHFDGSEITTIANGEVVTNEHDEPITTTHAICNSCRDRGINTGQITIPEDPMHSFNRPMGKSESTFKKWPFTRTAGVELETIVVAPIPIQTVKRMGWKLVHDASILVSEDKPFKGVEFNSPPLAGDSFFDSIQGCMPLWMKRVRVNASCGFHVHIDWSDLDLSQKAHAQNFLIGMQNLMFALQPPSRSKNQYCLKWQPALARPERLLSSSKYMGINFSHADPAPIFRTSERGAYGTIEFRMAAGTRNPLKVLRWVEFCQRLIEIGADLVIENVETLHTLTPIELLTNFHRYAIECDRIHQRPTIFLEELMAWLTKRLNHFTTVKHLGPTIQIPFVPKPVISFADAIPHEITSIDEIYEQRLGIQ